MSKLFGHFKITKKAIDEIKAESTASSIATLNIDSVAMDSNDVTAGKRY